MRTKCDCCARLWQRRASDKLQKKDGETPLFLATTCYVTEPKYVEVVRELLDNGADVNKTNKSGDAAIHNTTSLGNFETTELLIAYGADLDIEGEAKTVPLGLAAMKKHLAIVTIIVNNLLEGNKFTAKQFKWMFDAADDNQQLTIYRALSSIIQNKKALSKLIDLNLIDAACRGLHSGSKKGIITHALKLLLEILKIPEGVKSAQEKSVGDLVKESISSNSNDPVLKHLGEQVLDKIK